jgi:hypothetical protein
MDSNDPDTVACAFKQRLLRDVPEIRDANILEEFRSFVKEYLKANVPRAVEMSFDEWLESTSYDINRKNQLRESYLDLNGGRPSGRQCSHIDTFVKSESYQTWKHARMINSRCDAFKVWSGPKFKAIENVLYELPEFIKHTPVPDRPFKISAMKYAGVHYYQTDFTAFESHFTPAVLDVCECELYRHCLVNDVDAEFLCGVIMGENRMRTRTGISASCWGRRMSGDMCTSLGNGFTNLMLAKFIVSRKRGVINGFVEGDDGLFSTDVILTGADYEQLGFTIKIVEVSDPCRASFCGMVFSESGEIIRDPRRFMQNFGWTQSCIEAGKRTMDELMRAKALSCAYETPQCPIVGAFARFALKSTSHVRARFVHDGYHENLSDVVNVPAFSPSLDTRQLFEELYGVSIATQIKIEMCVMAGNFDAVAILLPPTEEIYEYSIKFLTLSN